MVDKKDKNQKSSTVESAPAKSGSTQAYLDIDQIREGVVILKDGSMKMVLRASSVNFELKSSVERDSIIYAYQNFLNSLEFPIQIIVQSRMLNLDNYLNNLKEKSKDEENQLLKNQMEDYMDFVKRLIKLANIMKKNFYVVVNHYPESTGQAGALTQLFSPGAGSVRVSNFEEEKRYLIQKVETAAKGLQSIGVNAVQLNTQELIELYYASYNPDQATVQKLIDISELESEVIEKAPDDMDIG